MSNSSGIPGGISAAEQILREPGLEAGPILRSSFDYLSSAMSKGRDEFSPFPAPFGVDSPDCRLGADGTL